MQKVFKSILSFCLAVAVCLGTAAIFGVTQYSVADADTVTEYYSGITAQSGTQLLGQLHDLITTTHTYYTSYDDCKEKNAVKTDPGSKSGTVMEFYTHIDIDASKWDVSGGWNREHVWAKSDSNGLWQTSGAGSDLHHIRPAEKDLNNHRGNMKYGEVGTSGKEEYTSVSHVLGGHSSGSSSTGTFEPLDDVKGDVARILMYVYTHYNTYSNGIFGGNATTNGKGNGSYFGTINFTHIVSASNEDAAKQLLLKWNKLDPVDQIEIDRNNAVYAIEHNRNPFIDNSSYADAIWGGGTVVDPPDPGPGPQPSVTLKSISLSATALNLSVGDTHNLTVTPNPGNASASVTWSSSDASVATVSGGKVTAKAVGTATITATSTVNTSIKATATVTVRQASSSENTAGKVTITRDSFTASGSYGFYSWTAGKIGGTAYIYAGNKDSMQFTTKQSSHFIASDKPTDGAIKKVTIETSGNSVWTLLTSTQPYSGITSGNPTKGTDHGEASGSTWTVNGNDTYFALVLGGSGAGYISSIEIEYATGGSTEKPAELQELVINTPAFSLQEGATAKLTASAVPANANTQVTWTSSNPSVATVAADGTVTAVKAGTATITATSTSNVSIKATATVTVTEAPFVSGSEKAQAFHNAVEAINSDGTLTTWRTTLNVAISAYKSLSATDKTEVAADIVKLNSAISSYNEKIKVYNDADKVALKGAGVFL